MIWLFWFKITATVSWFGHQNQACFSLSIAPQKRQRKVGAEHTSRSSDLLHVKASRARVSKSGRKTGGDATPGGAHVRLCYQCFTIFYVLDPRDIVVI
jgi:hypothetical protein